MQGTLGFLGLATLIVWIVDICKMFNDFGLYGKTGLASDMSNAIIHAVGVLGPLSWITVWWP